MAGEPFITVIANLAADPEARVSQAGKSWVTFRAANTPRTKDRQSGDWADGEPMWLNCRAYGDIADNIAATLTKGMQVILQGRLSYRTYKDNQNQDRVSLDFEIEACGPSLQFATAQVTRTQRSQGGGGGGWPGGSGQSSPQAAQTPQNGFGDDPQFGGFGDESQPF